MGSENDGESPPPIIIMLFAIRISMAKIALSIVAFSLMLTLVAGISLLEPLKADAGEAPIHLGTVGPGQTLELQISRDTGLPAAINPTTGHNAFWDQASVIRSTLPASWQSRDSLKYESPLTVFVTIGPEAVKGNYVFSVGFTDEYEGTAPQVAKFNVTVDPNVFDVSLDQPTVTAGVGQPAVFALRAKSKSVASDTFVIKASGLPYDWQFTKTFFLPHGSEQVVFFEVVGNIQKEVPFQINVTSVSSKDITKTTNAKVITQSTLLQDAKSTSLGLPLFPSVEQQVYAVVGLVSNLLFK